MTQEPIISKKRISQNLQETETDSKNFVPQAQDSSLNLHQEPRIMQIESIKKDVRNVTASPFIKSSEKR